MVLNLKIKSRFWLLNKTMEKDKKIKLLLKTISSKIQQIKEEKEKEERLKRLFERLEEDEAKRFLRN
jgi:uncharacterized protein involved in tolerance to divalent cations